jgi:hypothetical protein
MKMECLSTLRFFPKRVNQVLLVTKEIRIRLLTLDWLQMSDHLDLAGPQLWSRGSQECAGLGLKFVMNEFLIFMFLRFDQSIFG